MRIAFCPPDLKSLQRAIRGGPSDAMYLMQGWIAERLQACGHVLTFIGPWDVDNYICCKDIKRPEFVLPTWSGGPLFRLLKSASWRMQQLFGIPYLNIFSNLKLYDVCLHFLPGHDVVYERNGIYKTGVAMACRRLGVPYVLFVESDEIVEHDQMKTPITGMLRWWAKSMFRYNLNTANCIVCVSKPLKAHLMNAWKMPGEKIVVVPNGVDVDKFRPDCSAGSDIRISLNMTDNPLVLFVGNFYRWHDVEILLNAFVLVMESIPHARLVLVGDGTMRQAMEHRAAELGRADAVHFIGSVPHADVPRYIAAADVAVVPYPVLDREIWFSPLKLFEYMASGRAIVASAVGQVSDVIQNEYNGLLVPPGDVSAMANALKRLIADGDLRRRLGKQARDNAVEKHSWEKYISRLERVFAAVKESRFAGLNIASA